MNDWDDNEINKLVRKLLKSYAAKGVRFGIKKKVITLPNNRLRLSIKVLAETRVADIKRCANDVRLSLKLSVLEIKEEQTDISIVVSKDLPMDEHHLRNISKTPAFATAQKNMGLALSLGIDDLGNPVIVDLMDPRCPHIIVSGTSGSGKSVALKCMLTMTALMYPPSKVNFLIGDKANDLAQFKDLPHLSYPLIEDFDTFLNVLLVLKEEMDRRLGMKNTEEFSRLPIILCVVDEFNSLMSEAPDKRNSDLAVATITQILRMGRHARIHFILAAHNPTKANMQINTSDLPVKMAFQVSNAHNSVTALGGGGAEKLRGQGDMLFKMNGKVQHLQGAFISKEEIDSVLNWVRQNFNLKKRVVSPKQYRSQDRYFPRGAMGFTITDADLQRMKDKIQGEQIALPCGHISHRDKQSSNDRLFASIVAWTLNQDEISCNQISENFGIGWRRANSSIIRLHELGVVGELDAKLPRKVFVHSIKELPQNVAEYLQENGIV